MENTGPVKPEQNISIQLIRFTLGFTILLSLYGLTEFKQLSDSITTGVTRHIWRFLIDLSFGLILVGCVILVLTWTSKWNKIVKISEAIINLLSRLRWLNLGLFLTGVGLFSYAIYGAPGDHFVDLSPRLALFWNCVLAGGVFLKGWSIKAGKIYQRNLGEYMVISLIVFTFFYEIVTFLPNISSYPFTLSWSEISRYYNASLFFAKDIYGVGVPGPVLHPSRYMMQAVPFIIHNSPLWFHRAWQVLLWIGVTLLTSYVLTWRMGMGKSITRWLVIAWIFSFILLGPVYYHLQIPLIIMLWGFRTGKANRNLWYFVLSGAALVISSAWAGISRINWFPVPGLLAATIFILETPILPQVPQSTSKPSWWNSITYASKPILLTVFGTIIAFMAQSIYIKWSGNSSEQFTSSFTSDLLWYRLWPNPTFPPGILPGILVITVLMMALCAYRLCRRDLNNPAWKHFHGIRYVGLAGILLGLLCGGLVVSVKIGGGSNLHNLDAYLAVLLVITSYFFFDKASPDQRNEQVETETKAILTDRHNKLNRMLISTILVSVSIFAINIIYSTGPGDHLPDRKQTEKSLAAVVSAVSEATQNGGEVLFISNRHLLTFHYIENVPLIPDYERVFLMEMAMAGNSTYLEKFHNDLKNQRFAMIVIEPLFTQEKGRTEIFGEENDAWVREVTNPILCYYKSEKIIRPVRVELFVPNPLLQECK